MTTISRRVETAIQHMLGKDYENALIQICIALDATAKKIFPGAKVGKRIKGVVKKHEALIYKFASGGMLRVHGGKIILGNEKELPDIIYESVRCTLQHGDELSDFVVIKEGNNVLGFEGGKIIINIGHIFGLLFSVICDPVNETERCNSDVDFTLNGEAFKINEMWGKIEKVNNLFQ